MTSLLRRVALTSAGLMAILVVQTPQASAEIDLSQSCVPNAGQSCTSETNECSLSTNGHIMCDGTCDAVTPPVGICKPACAPDLTFAECLKELDSCVPNYRAGCVSVANSCGQTMNGQIRCDGSCSAEPPLVPYAGAINGCDSNGVFGHQADPVVAADANDSDDSVQQWAGSLGYQNFSKHTAASEMHWLNQVNGGNSDANAVGRAAAQIHRVTSDQN